MSAGANVKAVQRMLGHASAAMTLDVYSGLFTADLDAVAEHMHEAATTARAAAAGGVAPLRASLGATARQEAAALGGRQVPDS